LEPGFQQTNQANELLKLTWAWINLLWDFEAFQNNNRFCFPGYYLGMSWKNEMEIVIISPFCFRSSLCLAGDSLVKKTGINRKFFATFPKLVFQLAITTNRLLTYRFSSSVILWIFRSLAQGFDCSGITIFLFSGKSRCSKMDCYYSHNLTTITLIFFSASIFRDRLNGLGKAA